MSLRLEVPAIDLEHLEGHADDLAYPSHRAWAPRHYFVHLWYAPGAVKRWGRLLRFYSIEFLEQGAFEPETQPGRIWVVCISLNYLFTVPGGGGAFLLHEAEDAFGGTLYECFSNIKAWGLKCWWESDEMPVLIFFLILEKGVTYNPATGQSWHILKTWIWAWYCPKSCNWWLVALSLRLRPSLIMYVIITPCHDRW